MEKTKKTILRVNRKEISSEEVKRISDVFSSDGDCVLPGYGIEIWEKNLITGEMKLIREDPDAVEYEEEEEVDEESEEMLEAVEDQKETIKGYHPSKKGDSIFSDEANDLIKNNYKNMTDYVLVDLIKSKTCEEFSREQIKCRRKLMGFYKGERNLKCGRRPKTEIKPKPKESKVIKSKNKYGEIHFNFLRDNIEEFTNKELCEKFNKKFNMSISVPSMTNIMFNNKIKRKPKGFGGKIKEELDEEETNEFLKLKKGEDIMQDELENPNPLLNKSIKDKIKKSKRKGMSDDVIEMIEENYMASTDDKLREMIADKFNVFHATDKIAAYRESNGMARPQGWSPEGFDMSEESEDGED